MQGGFPARLTDLRALACAALAAAAVAGALVAVDGRGGGVPSVSAGVSSIASAGEQSPVAGASAAAAGSAYGKLPLAFEPNRGQSDERVRFLARGAGYGLFLTAGEAVLSLKPTRAGGDASGLLGGGSSGTLGAAMSAFGAKRGAVLRFGLVGANPDAKITGSQRLPGQSNYMVGADPRRWQTAIPHYAKVRYSSVYPGTDLVYYGRQGQLEYDFVLAPGADPGRIAFSVAGAQRVFIDGRGDLVLSTAGGDVIQRRPVVYQQIGSQRRQVPGRYVLQGQGRVGFALGAYDRSRPLVIDPVIAYSTYLGGTSGESGGGIAVDASGIYVTGGTGSTDFPKENPAQASYGGTGDVFITKLNPAGSALVYSTFLGGTGSDQAFGIAVDGPGNAYVTGNTTSLNFPVAAPAPGSPIQPSIGGITTSGGDAFVAKLSSSGALSYSTYLGGTGGDSGNDIAVDSAGSAYVTGTTEPGYVLIRNVRIPTFPTKNPMQGSPGDSEDAFVTKLSFSGVPSSDLVYSTYLGGSGYDSGLGIAVDPTGSAYVVGNTGSSNFPRASALQTTLGGTDAFVSKFTPAGSALSYSTYLGGSNGDGARAVAVDSAGRAHVTGSTQSTNFPLASAVQEAKGAGTGSDAFVTKFNSGGTLLSSTYLGGSQEDYGYGIAVDSAGSAHVTGDTNSTDLPTRAAPQAAKSGGYDAFASKYTGSPDAALSSLDYSTYLGGTGVDHGDDVAVDSAGHTYVMGDTTSANFPVASAFQPAPAGGVNDDAFVSKLRPGTDLSIAKAAAPDPVQVGQPLSYTLSVVNAGPDVAKAVSVRDVLPVGVELLAASPGCTQASRTVTCSVGDMPRGTLSLLGITVRPTQATAALSNTASVASQTFDPVPANDSSSVSSEVRAAAVGSADVSLTKSDSPDPVRSGQLLTYTLMASNAGPDVAEGVVVRDVLPAGAVFVPGASSAGCSEAGGVVSCGVEDLASGDSAQREIVVRPSAPSPALSNTATVSSATGDPLSSNNTATQTTVVQAVADVSVTKSDAPDPVAAGQPLTYTLTASNTGPDVAPGVVVQDTLPDGVQLASASGCSVTDGAVSCNVGDLASGVSSERKIVVRPTEATPALSNTATVQTTAVDENSANDSQTATTEVREAPAPPPPDGGTTPPPGDPGGSVGATPLAPGPFAPPAPLLPSAPPTPAALVAISDQGISPRRFSAAPSGPSALAAARKRTRKPKVSGAKVSYRLNMAASVRFTVSQTLPGRKQGKGKNARCVAQTKRNRKAARCRRVVTLNGSFVMSGRAGANSFRFTGRLANKKLKRGSYTLTATPSANGKTGKLASLSFTITK